MPQGSTDPIMVLREYRSMAPWHVRDLCGVAAAVLDAAGIRPTSGAAATHPTPRTIRYYIAAGLLTPPTGRGAAAVYVYRHLVTLLWIKSRQMEGAPLNLLRDELATLSGDQLERRVAQLVGAGLPHPGVLMAAGTSPSRGRARLAAREWNRETSPTEAPEDAHALALTRWHHFPLTAGLELHIHEGHPLAERLDEAEQVGEAIRRVIQHLIERPRP